MRYRALSLIVLVLLSTSLTAQTTSKEIAKRNVELERQRLREQAYETVKSVWADSRNIADARQRSEINARAFRLVGTREPELARVELTKNFDDFLGMYSSTSKDSKDRLSIEVAINKIVSALADKDSVAAQKLQQRYFEARRQAIGDKADDKRELADTLDLASDLLDTDLAQSIQLAKRVFEKVIPEIAIQYLFNLQQKDPKSAQQLYQHVLMLLASGQHYSPRAAIFLSIYAFSETQLVFPGVLKGPEGKPTVTFLISPTLYEPPGNGVDLGSANAFISATYKYLRVRALQGVGDDRSDLGALCSYYFLAQKVRAYAQSYGLDPENQWVRYETALTGPARQAGATDSDLALLVQQAQKLSARKASVPDSDDETALGRAAEEKDQKKKATLQVNGIMWLLRQKQFTKAEQRIDLLEDLIIRSQMSQIVKVFIAKDAIDTHRWDGLLQRIAKVEDRAMKIYLLLEAIRVIGDSKTDRDLAMTCLSDAKKSLEAMDNGIQKAAGGIAMLALTQTIDPAAVDFLLNDVSKTINDTEKYQGEKYFAVLPLPPSKREFAYQLKEVGFEDCFARWGKQDWIDTDVAARNLQNKYLQAWARLAAAKAFLEKKDS